MKIVLAGGSGSLGRRLAADLASRGHEVVILSRSPQSSFEGVGGLTAVVADARTLVPRAGSDR